MAVTIADFWQILERSRLVGPEHCRALAEQFGQIKGASGQVNAAVLAEWLVKQSAISKYQAKILLSGKTGPFFYDEYVLFDRISDGPLNGSFRAMHPASRFTVVLNFLDDSDPHKDETWLAAGEAIIAAAQCIGHPNLQDRYQLLELGRKRVVVMADVPGTSLDKFLAQRGRLAPHEACRIVRDVLLGMNAIHQTENVYHATRPANVIIDDATGISTLLQPPVARDFSPVPGTVDLSPYTGDQLAPQMDYMAPELAHAGVTATPLSDVYAAGCLLYQLLSGRPPFAGGDVAAKFLRHASEPVQPLEMLGVPPQLAQVVLYAMAKDPSIRYQSAAQLAEAVTYFVDPQSLRIGPRPAPTKNAYYQWLQSHPRIPKALENALYGEPAAVVVDPGFVSSNGEERGSKPAVGGGKSGGVFEDYVAKQEAQRQAAQKKMLIGLIVGMAAMLIGFIVYKASSGDRSEDAPISVKPVPMQPPDTTPAKTMADPETAKSTNSSTENTKSSTENANDPGAARPLPIADDGKTLWASPTNGPPLKFPELPIGAQIFMSVRPAELLSKNRFTPRLLTAAGPAAEMGRQKLEADTGFNFTEIELLQIAWAESNGTLTPVYYLRLKKPANLEQWLPKVGNPTVETIGEKSVYRGAKLSYHWSPGDEGRRLIATYPRQMKELLETPARPNPKIERLLDRSDELRLVNLVFAPNVLATNAATWLPGQEKLFQAIEKSLDYDTAAVGFSLQIDESNAFFELKFLPNAQSAAQAAQLYAGKFKSWSPGMLNYVSDLLPKAPFPYGFRVLNAFSAKVAKLASMTRVDEEQGMVVARAYLNAAAAEHLVLGTELAIAYSGTGAGAAQFATGDAVAGTPTAGATSPTQPSGNTVADKLKRKTSLTFARDNLENSIKLLSDDLGIPIEILGGDLQLEGITKNQSFGLEEIDKPATEILQTICKKANPDGKLVYIIKPKAAGEPEMIFVTTRAAVAKRGDKLPPEFVVDAPKPPAKK